MPLTLSMTRCSRRFSFGNSSLLDGYCSTAQAIAREFVTTLEDYPPHQRPQSFNLDQIVERSSGGERLAPVGERGCKVRAGSCGGACWVCEEHPRSTLGCASAGVRPSLSSRQARAIATRLATSPATTINTRINNRNTDFSCSGGKGDPEAT